MNIKRLKENFSYLQQHFSTGEDGYNRLAFSNEEKFAINWAISLIQHLPVKISKDTVGNVIITYKGKSTNTIAFGSHLDTVKNGGLFDGALGVLAAIECLLTWYEKNYIPDKSIELIIFIAEEANPLGGTFGSRALVGQTGDVDPQLLLDITNLTTLQLQNAKSKSKYDAFVELHIEQGAILENRALDIGIVHSINGIIRTKFTFYGEARHAGTTPMNLRQDALVNASQFILYANKKVLVYENYVCTIGEMYIKPNSASVVPGEVQLILEIRGDNYENMKNYEQLLIEWLLQNNIPFEASRFVTKHPNIMHKEICQVIQEVCTDLNYTYTFLPSGANHDANSMASICPTSMIFIPSLAGISHHPDEFSTWEQITKGCIALKVTMEKLSSFY